MATVFEDYSNEKQRPVVSFCGQKDSMQTVFIKKCLRWEVFVTQSDSQLGGKRLADDEEVETEVRMWPRQQSKDFYGACFDALVKRWDKCINVCRGYVEK
jgi:hypothetical protein